MIELESIEGRHYNKLKSILGKKYINSVVESPFDFIGIAEKGINANIISNFRKYFDLTLQSTAQILNTSEPTIYRWIKGNSNLERNLSVKIFEITDLFLYGIEVFDSKENFFQWIDLPNTALGGRTPRGLIEIPSGNSKVRDLLGRIEHGVYS